MRLGISPPAALTPTGVFNQRFEALFPRAGALGLRNLFCSPFVPPGLSVQEYGTTGLPVIVLSPVLSAQIPVSTPPTIWMNVSALTPWLSDFHTV